MSILSQPGQLPRRRTCDDYTIGWICALDIEMKAARELMDEVHPPIGTTEEDNNAYIFGRIGDHNVVIAGLPIGLMGTISAAAVAMDMKRSFRRLRFGLMVGIGGGIPTSADVRLGDIIVSTPSNGHGGVVQWDFGKATDGKFVRTGFLNAPPTKLLNNVQLLRSDSGLENKIRYHLRSFDTDRLRDSFLYQGHENDQLFENDFEHIQENENPAHDTCKICEELGYSSLKRRNVRTNPSVPRLHYGTILSGNQVVRDAKLRDEWGRNEKGICFEMEAAGLMQNFPCLVIRGICDYSDSHKNDRWQPYAAATAAVYAKILLLQIPPQGVREIPVAFLDDQSQQAHHLAPNPLFQARNQQAHFQQAYPQQPPLYPNGSFAGPSRPPQNMYSSPSPQLQYWQAYQQQQPQPYPTGGPYQPPANKEIAEWMVENGRGLERPKLTDPLPNTDKFIKDSILQMRVQPHWNWSTEHKFSSGYMNAKIKNMNDSYALEQAQRFHGLR